MYYPCSENKGTDQLRGYREADLRLCIRICKNPVFSQRGSYMYYPGLKVVDDALRSNGKTKATVTVADQSCDHLEVSSD